MSNKRWGVVDSDKSVLIDTLANKKSDSISLFLQLKGQPHGQKDGHHGLTADAARAWAMYRAVGHSCIRVSMKHWGGG